MTWTFIPVNLFDLWLWTWTVIPEQTNEFSSLIWTVPLFDRTVYWFSIPAKNWLLWLLTWTVISLLIDVLNFYSCKTLFDLWLLTYFLAFVWILLVRWIDSAFREHCLNFSINEMNQCLNCWLELIFSFWSVAWTFLLFDLWLLTWAVIPAKLLNCNSRANDWILIQYSREIIEPLFPSDRLNFDRWFDPIFPRNWWLEWSFKFWSMNLHGYSRDNFGLIWLLTWTVIPKRTFQFSSSNPATFVWLRNGRFPAFVLPH